MTGDRRPAKLNEMSLDANPYASLPGAGTDAMPREGPVPAGRMRRLAATLLDFAVTGAACFAALVMIFAVDDLADLKLSSEMIDPMAALTFLITTAALHLPFLSSGRSIGKKLLGLRIKRSDGSAAGPARLLFLRHGPHILGLLIILLFLARGSTEDAPFAGLLLLFPFALPLGWLLILREDRRTLYDLLADTMVVRE